MVRPLTKRRGDGERYVRPAAVQREIESALQQDLDRLRERLLVTSTRPPDYLSSECLVHLIRASRRRDDVGFLNAVLPVLFGRCEAILQAKIADSLPNAEDLREEVLSQFGELLASDGRGVPADALDVYEVRFNMAFRALRIDVVRREKRRVEPIVTLPSGRDDDVETDEYDEELLAKMYEELRAPAGQLPALFLAEVLEEIKRLPPDEGKALVLCAVYGFKVESIDPDETTVATLCKCTGRTIRNRLSRAVEKLSLFKEDL